MFFFRQVLVEEKAFVRTLTLNRPRQLNALSSQMVRHFIILFQCYFLSWLFLSSRKRTSKPFIFKKCYFFFMYCTSAAYQCTISSRFTVKHLYETRLTYVTKREFIECDASPDTLDYRKLEYGTFKRKNRYSVFLEIPIGAALRWKVTIVFKIIFLVCRLAFC